MNTRRTEDYSPTKYGSPEYFAAINARREMLNCLSHRTSSKPQRKTWAERMQRRAKGFKLSTA